MSVIYTNDTPVVLLVANHKRGKSFARMALYNTVTTCGAYIAACTKLQGKGLGAADLQWDFARGFISINGLTATPKAVAMPVINPVQPEDVAAPAIVAQVVTPAKPSKAQRKAMAKAA